VTAELKDASRQAQKGDGVGYPERMEITRKAIKLVADTGGHPKSRRDASS
jgi:hypothetical protein